MPIIWEIFFKKEDLHLGFFFSWLNSLKKLLYFYSNKHVLRFSFRSVLKNWVAEKAQLFSLLILIRELFFFSESLFTYVLLLLGTSLLFFSRYPRILNVSFFGIYLLVLYWLFAYSPFAEVNKTFVIFILVFFLKDLLYLLYYWFFWFMSLLLYNYYLTYLEANPFQKFMLVWTNLCSALLLFHI